MEPKKEMVDKKVPVKPLHLDSSSFEQALKRYPVVLVDGWASWCMPCRMVAPVIDALAMEMKGKVVFGKVNVDENPDIAAKLGMYSIPNLVLFVNGEEVDRTVGAMPKEVLKQWLVSHLET